MSPLLGLDYGLRRIGIAVSDDTDSIATALGAHTSPADGSLFTRLRELIAARDITGIILGLPLTTTGQEGEMAQQVRRFARKLAEETGLPVFFVDERYSSREADGFLRLGGGRRHAKAERDALAAALILQQYLDGCAPESSGNGGEES